MTVCLHHSRGNAGCKRTHVGCVLRSIAVCTLLSFFLCVPNASGTTSTVSVTLAWNASADSSVVGYNIYFGAGSMSYTNIVGVTNVTMGVVPGLTPGVQYFFAVTARDASGLESSFSNEVSYTPPANETNGAVLLMQLGGTGVPSLKITGEPGARYEILASEDMLNWSVIDTVTLGSTGSYDYSDPAAASFSRRFYRVRGI